MNANGNDLFDNPVHGGALVRVDAPTLFCKLPELKWREPVTISFGGVTLSNWERILLQFMFHENRKLLNACKRLASREDMIEDDAIGIHITPDIKRFVH